MKFTTRAALVATALFAVPCQAQTNMLRNPSFENGGVAAWDSDGSVFHETTNPPAIVPRTGRGLIKMFGQFTGSSNVSLIFQRFPAAPADQFMLDCWSRHWDGDPITGTMNSMVMKIAFFDDMQNEIGGAEQIILDGNSLENVWIDNPQVTAVAPSGTAEVQALILFLQPGVEGGAGLVDDVTFFGTPDIPPYPGTGEDLLLTTGVGPGGTSGGKGNYIRTATAGDLVECKVESPGGTWDGAPYLLLTQAFRTGSPPTPLYPSLYFRLGRPIFILVGGFPAPIFGPVIAPGGSSTFFVTPPGLAGNSIMLQAMVFDPATILGLYAASDGLEIQFQ